MKRNMRLLLTLIKMRLSHLMVFRLSFFGAFFVDGSMFLIQLLFFDILYGQTGGVGGWQRGEVTIFVGTFSLVNALNMSTFFFGLITIPEKIRTGGLDLYLTKPGSPLIRLSFERMDPGSLPLIALSLVIIVRGAALLPAPPGLAAIAGYVLTVLLMTLLWYDLMLILRTMPFFVLSAATLEQMEASLIELSIKVPGTVFQGAWKVLFQFVLPYGLIATLPTQVLAGMVSVRGLLAGCAVAAAFTCIALRLWRLGLSHYKSGGG